MGLSSKGYDLIFFFSFLGMALSINITNLIELKIFDPKIKNSYIYSELAFSRFPTDSKRFPTKPKKICIFKLPFSEFAD